jgi:aminoglycoside phosphotransferase
VQLSEASTLRYVGENTYIPVPKVHCALVHKDKTYILMERIDGKTLIRGWRTRSTESKGKILVQLKNMVDQLRSLPPPSSRISNVDGGPVYDCRFPGTSLSIGPFDTIHDFHCFLRNGVEAHPGNLPDVNRMVALQDRPWPMPVFTHGDLSSFNILVRGDDVVGIIDWETSGWYPSYWEYSMARHANPRNIFWREEVSSFLDATPEEEEMEQIRLAYFGDV